MRSLSPVVLFAVCLGLALPAAAAEVHPFYEQRLTAGILALSQGAATTAENELRLAAFGLLDDPPRLTIALAHLALAAQATGNAARRDQTLQRLLALEQRFTVWNDADLAPETRGDIEALLAERIPEAGLSAVPAFRRLADARAAERIAALPPAERRRELAALVAAQPDSHRWQLMLGEIELAGGDAAAAVDRAQRVLASQPTAPDETAARCLRGTALARSGACAAAVADLEACPATRREAGAARLLLECHAQLGQWRQAKELADTLPAAVRSHRDLRRTVRQVERESSRLPAATAPGNGSETSPPSGQATPAPSVAVPEAAPATPSPAPASQAPSALPASDRQRLDEARRLMAEARRASELEEALAIAIAVADAHPRSVEAQHLAAEIAYRGSRWPLAVSYFRRGGDPIGSPELMFYFAVALWEAGASDEAARVLDAALPRLPASTFVDEYVARILGRLR